MEILIGLGYIIILIIIFYFLAKICDRYFVKSLDIISNRLNLSEDVAGATLMAMGSSAPEFFTSMIAVFSTSEEVGAGTIVGSAIFNVLVIVGASAMVSTAFLQWKPIIRDLGVYVVAILLLLLTFFDGKIELWEAGLYVLFYGIYLLILAKWKKALNNKEKAEIEKKKEELKKLEENEEPEKESTNPIVKTLDQTLDKIFPDLDKKPELYWLTFTLSITLIGVLSFFMVETAVEFSHLIGIPAVIISLTVLAAGTSVPDLLSSIIVAKKGRGDMAVSNAVGSNNFDIMIGLGLPWLLYILFSGNSVSVGTENLTSSILLLFFTVISLLTLLILQKFKIGKPAGALLVGLYLIYVVYSLISY